LKGGYGNKSGDKAGFDEGMALTTQASEFAKERFGATFARPVVLYLLNSHLWLA